MSVVTHVRLHSGAGEDFGPRADGFVCLHTWEGDPLRTTVADALAPGALPWQDQDSVLGSYNRVICSDGVIQTVPDGHASGGINPFSAGFRPLTWLYGAADASEVNNPNAFGQQLCFFGRKAHYDANGWPVYMINAAARSWIEEEQRTGRKQVLCNHADFQPGERSDAGPIATALVKQRYLELTRPQEDDMPALRPVRQQWTTGTGPGVAADADVTPGGEFWTLGPEQGDPKIFTTAEKVWTIAETLDGKWRAVEYGAGVLWMHRNNLRPIAGTRNPVSGFGSPSLSSGIPKADLDAAMVQVAALNKRIATKDAHITQYPKG